LYAIRWQAETFSRDSKQDLGFGDYEFRQIADASGDWHLLMLAYSFLEFGAAHSTLATLFAHASPLRKNVKRFLCDSIQNLLFWALNSPNHNID